MLEDMRSRAACCGVICVLVAIAPGRADAEEAYCATATLSGATFWLTPGWEVGTTTDSEGNELDQLTFVGAQGTVRIAYANKGTGFRCPESVDPDPLFSSYWADSNSVTYRADGAVQANICADLYGSSDQWIAMVIGNSLEAMRDTPGVLGAVFEGLRDRAGGDYGGNGCHAGFTPYPEGVTYQGVAAFTPEPEAVPPPVTPRPSTYAPSDGDHPHERPPPAPIYRRRLGVTLDRRSFAAADAVDDGTAFGVELEVPPLHVGHAAHVAWSIRGAVAREAGATVGDAAVELGAAVRLGDRAELFALLVAGLDVVAGPGDPERIGAFLGGARGVLRVSVLPILALEVEAMPLYRQGSNSWRAAGRVLLPRASHGYYLEVHHRSLGEDGALNGVVVGLTFGR
jgi:hypothetical protein